MRVSAIAGFGVALALLCCGCQADGSLGDDPVQPASNDTAASSPMVSGGASSGRVVYASTVTEAPADFPLVPYWDAARRGTELFEGISSDEALKDWHDRRQDALAGCMKGKGFLYFPSEWLGGSEDGLNAGYFNDRDFLGFPRLPETRGEVQAVGYGVQPKRQPDGSELPDKNQEYFDSLDAKAKGAYSVAYVGVDNTAPDYDPYQNPDEELGGCLGQVEKDFPDLGDAHAARNVREHHGDVIADMTILARHGGIFEEKEMMALNRQWRSCMAGTGIVTDEPKREGNSWDGPLQAFMLAVRTDPSGAVGLITDSTPDDQSRLVGSAAEREVALLDFDCRAETDYEQRFTAIQRRREQDFVDANRKALDSMMAFVEGLS
jgi:hypothetical protein